MAALLATFVAAISTASAQTSTSCSSTSCTSSIYPGTSVTTDTINVAAYGTYNYYMTWNIVGQDCNNPTVSFVFEANDLDGGASETAYLYVDGSYFADCTDPTGGCCSTACGYFSTCLTDQVAKDVVTAGNTFQLRLTYGSGWGNYCTYGLQATATLQCDATGPSPTPQPTPRPTAARRICDITSVNAGETLECSYTSVLSTGWKTSGTDFSWPINFYIRNLDDEDSYCANPRLTVEYLANDFVGDTKWLQVTEGEGTVSRGATLLGTCGLDTTFNTCTYQTCFSEQALSGNYQNDNNVAITLFASTDLDGRPCNGQTDLWNTTLTLKCTRSTTPQPTSPPSPTPRPTPSPTNKPTTLAPTKKNRGEPSTNDAVYNAPNMYSVSLLVWAVLCFRLF